MAGVGGGAALLVACAPAATSTSAPATAAAGATTAPSGTKTAVSFWTPGGTDAFCGFFNTIAQNFEVVEPSIEVGDVKCGTGTDYNEALLADIAAGTPPDSTILWTSPVAFAGRDALVALDDLMANSKYSQLENWPAGVLASCQYKGQTWGLPATAGTYGIFYNAEMFEAKGIPSGRDDFPKTWDDLKRLSAEFVSWNGDTLETAGIMPWQNGIELAMWSAANGSQLYDTEAQKFTINSEQNIEMMQYSVDWLDEQYNGDWVKVQASNNWLTPYVDANGRPPAFQGNKLAMHLDGFWLTADMYDAELQGWSNWNVAPLPVGPSGSQPVSGYWPSWLVIPKGSQHVNEAFKYLDYMSVEGMKVWFDNIPVIAGNKLFPASLVPQILVEKRSQEFAEDVTAFFRSQLDAVTPMWNSPVQDFANDQINRATDKIIRKQATPTDALTEAQNASQAELEKVLG